MKFKIVSLLRWLGTFCTFCGIILFDLNAQQAITTSGGDVMGNGGSVAYSVGQVVYTVDSGSAGSLNKGVQQTYEIFPVNIEKREKQTNISVDVYPNPSGTYITVEIQEFNNQHLTFRLLDMQGKLIKTKPAKGRHTKINSSDLPPATYFLTIAGHESKENIVSDNIGRGRIYKRLKIIKR